MQLRKSLVFAFQAVTAGLALAFVVVILRPELLSVFGPEPTPSAPAATQGPTVAPEPTSGPVSYADAVARSAPAVVNISTAKLVTERANPLFDDPLFRRFFGDRPQARPRQRLETSLGSGVIVSPDGHVLTNNHVIAGADQILVQLADGQVGEARLVGADPESDLAVLEADLAYPPPIAVGSSDTLRVGDVVLAIGNPYGVGQTVTMGIVSATGRTRLGISTFEDFIQTDAAINPGNSGGALVNAAGELVGINTAIFSRTGGSQGIGFAIPVSLANRILEQIVEHGRVVRGWIGIEIQDLTPEFAESFGLPEPSGVLIAGVMPGGPADRAGIVPGDVVTRVAGQPIGDANAALDAIVLLPPGEPVVLQGWHDRASTEWTVEVEERPLITPR
ncbi:MAG: trypsin-like peptidase domain-containing protein [Gammaproteobacteria bacterium]|nr:trypsin-like peptidase domain-containing protein [Gammaproteobacteria bacterium]